MNMRTRDKHSVNCMSCGKEVDERDCLPGCDGEGDYCADCVRKATEIITEDGFTFSKQPDGTWSDGDMTFDGLGEMGVTFKILEMGGEAAG